MELTERQKLVREKLIECARERRTVSYREASSWVDYNPSPLDIGKLILDPINKHEQSKGRPLLSAIVVQSPDELGFPGTGFIAVAKKLHVFEPSEDDAYLDRIAFLHSEVQRVFDMHARFEDLQ